MELPADFLSLGRGYVRIFPPSFFDIMMHLPMHLASEAKIAGLVQYRWMYPIERCYYDSNF